MLTKIKKSRQTIRRMLPGSILALLIALGLLYIYSNSLYRFLGLTTQYTEVRQSAGFEISFGAKRSFEMRDHSVPVVRDLRISLPISAATHGCEMLYAAAVYDFSRNTALFPGPGQFAFTNPRYLVKFKYDLKNKRCESKDLFVMEGDLPQAISIQFVDLIVDQEFVSETPREVGLRLKFKGQNLEALSFDLESIPLQKSFPFIAAKSTPRNKSFSLPKFSNFELLIHPYRSLNEFILNETKRRIEKCKSTHVCDKIQAAVAKISDLEFFKLIEQARSIGMSVELISNFRYRLDQEADEYSQEGNLFNYSPWQWLRGSPYSKFNTSHLPMHTKFVIFGDDLVVSSNPNLRGGIRTRSREFSLVYRDPAVVKIFSEIFTLVRTSLYYPLKVNLNDELIILFNAVRPRAYAVSTEKPYVVIETDEGVRSSAYGVLYEILERLADKPLSLLMSPISNSCAPYTKDHCLFDLLETRAKQANLDMYLNAFYYIPESVMLEFIRNPKSSWTSSELHRAIEHNSAYQIFTNWFEKNSGQPQLSVELGLNMGTHHERLALLGDEISILGSANWGNSSTLNTIELIKNHALNQKLRSEYNTFREPWFVGERKDARALKRRYAHCEFLFEVPVTPLAPTAPRNFSKAQVMAEMAARYPEAHTDSLQIVEPILDQLMSGNESQGFSKRALSDQFTSLSSYLCLENQSSSETFVLRLVAQPYSD